jgi:hypothetical protein
MFLRAEDETVSKVFEGIPPRPPVVSIEQKKWLGHRLPVELAKFLAFLPSRRGPLAQLSCFF